MSSPSPIPTTQKPTIELSYKTHTPPFSSTSLLTTPSILFLHGLETSTLEYTLILPFLAATYKIHLIDLPGHSTSKKIPFTLPNAISGLANHISTKIPGGKAHIVGLSLGGYVGLKFTQEYPEMVASLFCTGCSPSTGVRKWSMERPWLLANLQIGVNKWLPISEKMFWAPIGVTPFPELRKVMKENSSYELLVAGYSACSSVTLEDLAEIRGVRVAIVAGAKRDDVEGTRDAGEVLRKGNEECRAFVVRKAVHLWDLQFPKLFADGVRAWVESGEMPSEFEVLV